MQLLDTNHILIRYASEEVATLQANEPNAQPALLVVYDMVEAKVLAVYDNASTELLTQFENFSDFFRNARMTTDCQYMCSPSNNIYARYNTRFILFNCDTTNKNSTSLYTSQIFSSSLFLNEKKKKECQLRPLILNVPCVLYFLFTKIKFEYIIT